MGSRDVKEFLIPDFSKFAGAVPKLAPAWSRAIEFLVKELPGSETTGSEEWKHPFYAIWEDIPLCGWALCLPCCLVPRTTAAITGDSCEEQCLLLWLTCCVGGCYRASERRELRNKYNIKGSQIEDCLLTWCCGCCTTVQEARELGDRGAFAVPFTAVGGKAAFEVKGIPAAQNMARTVPEDDKKEEKKEDKKEEKKEDKKEPVAEASESVAEMEAINIEEKAQE